MGKNFLDTNILIELHQNLFDIYDSFVVSSTTLLELEHIKTGSKSEDVKYKARKVVKLLNKNLNRFYTVITDVNTENILRNKGLLLNNDNLIMADCLKFKSLNKNEDITFVTNDIVCKIIGKCIFDFTVESYQIEDADEIYLGYKEIDMDLTDEVLAELCLKIDSKDNLFDMNLNEYLIIKNNNEVDSLYKWTNDGFELVKYKPIKNKMNDKINPRNTQQELAFNMIQDNNTRIKCIVGKMGSGKDLIMINQALSLIEKGSYQKIVWIIQNQIVSETRDMGALPGTLHEKMLPFTSILGDKVGGQFGLEMFISNNQIEIVPLSFIRGRSFDDSILMISEAENITKEHMQLIIGRIGDGSCLWVNGDFKQTDKEIFKTNSGLKALINKLKGNEEFGYVMLQKTERSKLAQLADLLD